MAPPRLSRRRSSWKIMTEDHANSKVGLRRGVVFLALLVAGFAALGLCHRHFDNLTSRIVHGIFAVVFLLMALGQIRAGEMKYIDGRKWITRQHSPGVFWCMTLLLIGIGILLLIQRVWKS